MGARPLRRAIQRLIEDPLADFVLGRSLAPGSTIVVKRKNEEEVDIEVIPPVDAPEPAKVGATASKSEGDGSPSEEESSTD
jgi:ATP-dependent Clp protease ATP-binding subunit ClpC